MTRTFPHNLEAEQGTLGSLLLAPHEVFPLAEARIAKESFYHPAHGEIYDVYRAMYASRLPADIITLVARFRELKRLEHVGGAAYLTSLIDFTPTAANAEYYIEIVAEMAARRQIIAKCEAAAAAAYGLEELASLDERIHALASERAKAISTGTEIVSMSDLVPAALERLEARHAGKGKLRGIPSGFPMLDRKTSGWGGGQMIVVGAPHKQGKSSLARQFAEHAALHEGLAVAIFSHEMSKEEIVDAMLASNARVDTSKIDFGTVTDEDFEALGRAVSRLSAAPIFVYDEAAITIPQYRANLRRAVQERGVKLIIVDYLQLIAGGGKEGNREREVAAVSRETKLLAKELNVPIIILCQLNKKGESRESMAIEQDADRVIIIEHENAEEEGNGKAWINLKLSRGTAKGKVPVLWRPAFTRFEERAADEHE